MRQVQSGVTLMGLFIALFVIIIAALLAMKLIPAYMEYATAKNAIDAIARERNAQNAAEVRRAFDARAAIDNITAVKASDLEISKDGAGIAINTDDPGGRLARATADDLVATGEARTIVGRAKVAKCQAAGVQSVIGNGAGRHNTAHQGTRQEQSATGLLLSWFIFQVKSPS